MTRAQGNRKEKGKQYSPSNPKPAGPWSLRTLFRSQSLWARRNLSSTLTGTGGPPSSPEVILVDDTSVNHCKQIQGRRTQKGHFLTLLGK